MRIGILEPYNFSAKALKKLKLIGTVDLCDGENQKVFIRDKEILFVRLKNFIGRDFLEDAKSLRFLCSPTTGLNHIDVSETTRRGITIVSLKGESEFLEDIRATPEHAFGLILALLRRYKDCFFRRDNDDWDRQKYIGSEIYNNTIGIIGYGRVGQLLAKYLVSFDAEVVFYDPNKNISAQEGICQSDSIEGLIQDTNIIILSASYSKENENFIQRKYIDLMKDKYFINISRGELVDEEYLILRMKEDFFKGVALDVIKNETGENNLDLLMELVEKQNIIITPHIGGATKESMQKTEDFIADKLIDEVNA